MATRWFVVPASHPVVIAAIAALFLVQGCASESTWERPGVEGDTSDAQGGAIPECHPLFQDCGPGTECYATDGTVGFECAAGSDAQGGFGAPCFDGLECEPGLLCSGIEVIAGCSTGFGCCTFFCELGETECGGGMNCEPYFASGGPPGFETLGVCQPGS